MRKRRRERKGKRERGKGGRERGQETKKAKVQDDRERGVAGCKEGGKEEVIVSSMLFFPFKCGGTFFGS